MRVLVAAMAVEADAVHGNDVGVTGMILIIV